MNTNQMGMHVVLVGNPVDGVKIYGPFKTGPDAAAWADENEPVDYWVAPLQEPDAVKPEPVWQGPFYNPFAAAMDVAAPDPEKIAAVQNAALDVFADRAGIVVQKRDDGWYATLDTEE